MESQAAQATPSPRGDSWISWAEEPPVMSVRQDKAEVACNEAMRSSVAAREEVESQNLSFSPSRLPLIFHDIPTCD